VTLQLSAFHSLSFLGLWLTDPAHHTPVGWCQACVRFQASWFAWDRLSLRAEEWAGRNLYWPSALLASCDGHHIIVAGCGLY